MTTKTTLAKAAKNEARIAWMRESLKPMTPAEVEELRAYIQRTIDVNGIGSLDAKDMDRVRLLLTLGVALDLSNN